MADFQGPNMSQSWLDEMGAKLNEIIRSEKAVKPIIIPTDFISHVDGETCRDVTCPCRAEPSIEVALSEQISACYDRVERAVTFYSWYAGRFELTAEETYRLLALLHAETMPAEGGVS